MARFKPPKKRISPDLTEEELEQEIDDLRDRTAAERWAVWRLKDIRDLLATTPWNGPINRVRILREAERLMAILVQRGQAEGPDQWIRSQHQRGSWDRRKEMRQTDDFFLTIPEREHAYVFARTPQEEWDKAILEGIDQGNLSRDRVRFLIDGTKKQTYIEGVRGVGQVPERPEHLKKLITLRQSRVVGSTVDSIAGAVMGLEAIEVQDLNTLDPVDSEHWIKSLEKSLTELRRLLKGLRDAAKESRGQAGVVSDTPVGIAVVDGDQPESSAPPG